MNSAALTATLLQWAPIIASAVAFAAAVITFSASQNNLWQRANDAEIQAIQHKLDSFYGPLLHRLEADHLLAGDLRERQSDQATYRLLAKLFDRAWLNGLSAGDHVIVSEICEHASKLEELIYANAGLVDERVFPYLVRAANHFRVLALAYAAKLGDDAQRFSRYVYPEQLDAVLSLEVQRLRDRVAVLRRSPGKKPAPIPPLSIPAALALQPWPDPPRGSPQHQTLNHD
jgi:hypothetical protein